MRIVSALLRLLLFFVIFGFALKNTEIVTLHFFFGAEWRLPLSMLLVLCFAIGLAFGLLAPVGMLLRLRRENSILKTESGAGSRRDKEDAPQK